jgi:hypothetical protein
VTALANAMGIQTYQEDSQFGLLKTSLAIAGSKFVLDVDLETDAAAGEEDDEVSMDQEASSTGGVADGTSRGKVRLSKLGVNHVSLSGATGRSEWIEEILKGRFLEYLRIWNESTGRGRSYQLQISIDGVTQALEELSDLDGLATSWDGFAELEVVIKKIHELTG